MVTELEKEVNPCLLCPLFFFLVRDLRANQIQHICKNPTYDAHFSVLNFSFHLCSTGRCVEGRGSFFFSYPEVFAIRFALR